MIQTDTSEVHALIVQSRIRLAKGLGIALLLVTVLGWAFTQYLMRPLKELRSRAQKTIKEYSGSDAMISDRGNEIRTTVHALDAMMKTVDDHIADRRQLDAALRESEERYRGLFESAKDVIFLLSPDGTFSSLNPFFETVTGWPCSEWIGRSFAPLIHPDDLQTALDAFTHVLQGETVYYELRIRSKSGAYINGDFTSTPLTKDGKITSVLGIARDVTAQKQAREEMLQNRKKMEERLFQEQKEESIVTLAGGIAHDFNNIIMSVLGNAELLSMRFVPGDREYDLAQNIVGASERMAGLTRQLLAYAKGGIYQPKVMSLNNMIRETLAFLGREIGKEISISLDLAEDLRTIVADPTQVRQALMNLFTNSFEAMEQTGGVLTVHTSNSLDRKSWECPFFHHEHPAGDYVYLRISDTGHGIPDDLQKKVFEPFFTTKFFGRGLGLPAAAGIVQNHKGCISVESEPGRSTDFHIYLPCTQDIEGHAISEKKAQKVAGQKTILIVDDEPEILSLLGEMLTIQGHEALQAQSGREALEIFRRERGRIDLAILDIQMPEMDGKRLFRELKSLDPGLKVLISSGYDETTAMTEMGSDNPDGFLQKPYLSGKLRKMLQKIFSQA
jgi:PAS domain S-box-containing protein